MISRCEIKCQGTSPRVIRRFSFVCRSAGIILYICRYTCVRRNLRRGPSFISRIDVAAGEARQLAAVHLLKSFVPVAAAVCLFQFLKSSHALRTLRRSCTERAAYLRVYTVHDQSNVRCAPNFRVLWKKSRLITSKRCTIFFPHYASTFLLYQVCTICSIT